MGNLYVVRRALIWPHFSEVFRVAFGEILLNSRSLHYGKFFVVRRALIWPNFNEVFRVAFGEILVNSRGLHYGNFLSRWKDCIMAKFL